MKTRPIHNSYWEIIIFEKENRNWKQTTKFLSKTKFASIKIEQFSRKLASIKIEQFSRNKMKYRRNQTINKDKTLLNNNLKSQKWCAWEIDNYTLNSKQWFLKLSEISIFQINVPSIMQFADEFRWTKISRESKTIVSWMIETLQFELIYLGADNNFQSIIKKKIKE